MLSTVTQVISLLAFLSLTVRGMPPNKGVALKSQSPGALSDHSPIDRDVHRIFGGQEAQIGEFMYQVAVRLRRDSDLHYSHHCGGSIITNRFIVTAAHCKGQSLPEQFQVVAGAHERNGRSTKLADSLCMNTMTAHTQKMTLL